jgi:hypothetical protein
MRVEGGLRGKRRMGNGVSMRLERRFEPIWPAWRVVEPVGDILDGAVDRLRVSGGDGRERKRGNVGGKEVLGRLR